MALTEEERAIAFLDEVKPIIKDIHAKEEEKRARGENFNVFSILGIETREFYICKMLGALLSPQGAHEAGEIFLEKFLEDVLNESAIGAETSIVRCEDATKERRRIDLTIEIDGKIIPIEAKIHAGDQEHQLADYFEEIKNRKGACAYICYLTKDGRKPSRNSMTSTSGNTILKETQIKRLSWKDDIVPWLEDCVALETVQGKTMVQANIWQLINTIRGWDNAMELQFKNIVNSDDRLDSALGIWQMVSAARNALWKNFLKEFESQMVVVHSLEKIKIPDENSSSGYKERESDYWFKKPEGGNYGIGLALKNGKKDNHCIGFCLFGSDGKFKDITDCKSNLSGSIKAEVDRLQERLGGKNNGKWLYREDFPAFKDEKINFYSFTKETAKLLFEENLKEYVDDFIRRIKELTGWGNQQTTSCVATTSD